MNEYNPKLKDFCEFVWRKDIEEPLYRGVGNCVYHVFGGVKIEFDYHPENSNVIFNIYDKPSADANGSVIHSKTCNCDILNKIYYQINAEIIGEIESWVYNELGELK